MARPHESTSDLPPHLATVRVNEVMSDQAHWPLSNHDLAVTTGVSETAYRSYKKDNDIPQRPRGKTRTDDEAKLLSVLAARYGRTEKWADRINRGLGAER